MRHPLLTASLPVLALALACGGGSTPAPASTPVPSPSTPPAPAAPAPSAGTASLQRLAFSPTDVPAGLATRGTVVDGARFQDRNGLNLVLLTRVTPFKVQRQPQDDDQPWDGELYGYHFVQKGTTWEELWTIRDFERSCTFDLTCDFLKGSLEVTDLDQDGEAETSFLYRTACRSDVSPASQKLLMHEGRTKYALRGTSRIDLPGESYGGEYTVDPAFDGAPPSFLAAAKARWAAFAVEMGG